MHPRLINRSCCRFHMLRHRDINRRFFRLCPNVGVRRKGICGWSVSLFLRVFCTIINDCQVTFMQSCSSNAPSAGATLRIRQVKSARGTTLRIRQLKSAHGFGLHDRRVVMADFAVVFHPNWDCHCPMFFLCLFFVCFGRSLESSSAVKHKLRLQNGQDTEKQHSRECRRHWT